MPVITAAEADLALVQQLVRNAPRRQMSLGEEDLSMLVAAGHVLLLVDAPDGSGSVAAGRAVGSLAAFYPEARPASLPPSAPDRVFLRAAAFAGGVSPSAALAALVDGWCRTSAARPRLLIAYGGEPWFNRSLLAAGCTLAEEVIYFELPDVKRAVMEGVRANLLHQSGQESASEAPRLASPAELDALAALDAAAFNVLWHMGAADLRQLLLFGRLTVAARDGVLAGYLALTVKNDTAQIARLAVHPAWSGRGIGRELLMEGLQAAHALGCRRAVLNTQTTNSRAQALYRSFGFRPTGERFEVYTRLA